MIKIVLKAIRLFVIICAGNYYYFLSAIVGFEQMTFRISTLPYRLGNDIRNYFYKKTLQSVGEKVIFSFGAVVTNRKTTIGNNVRLGPYSTVGWAKLGDEILIAQHVHILSGSKQHSYSRLDIPITNQKGITESISIDGDNWIGANVVIMNDIGRGSVIGSGSVVVKPVKIGNVVVGNPSKVVEERT